MSGERFDAIDRSGWKPAVRVDVGRLAKATRTAVGVRVEGVVARAGILTYQRADGSTFREYLPPEEAARLDSLRSLRDAPVTVSHPGGGARLVTPDTYRQDAVGHVSGEPRSDGRNVLADLAIQDAEAIRRVDAGELVELSAGYRVMLDPTPGVVDGQRYDAVQRERVYNHVALLPRGMARAGGEASLRLDGVEQGADLAFMRIDDDPARAPARAPDRAREPEVRVDSMKTERIDGIEYDIGSAAWAQARARFDAAQAAKIAELEKRAKDAEEKATQATARADAAEKRAKDLEEAASPARLDARVQERAALVAKVRPIVGAETKLDGLTDVQLMQLALAKLAPEFKADSFPEAQRETYIRARFDAEMVHAAKGSPLDRARSDAFTPPSSFGTPQTAGGGAPFRGLDPLAADPSLAIPRLDDKWRA